MPEANKPYQFDTATKYWFAKDSGHPTLSAIKPKEFPDLFNANFIIERLIGHHSANQAVIQSVPVDDTLVFNKLKKHILQLVERNKQVATVKSYPPVEDVAALTREQALDVYDGLLANFVSNFGEQNNLPEIDHTAEQLMLYSLEQEAEFSGYLLKSLDLYNLSRPAEMTKLYGDSKAPQSKGEETKNLSYWLTKTEEDQEEMHSDDANDLVIRVRDRINPTNNSMYDSIPDNFFRRNIRNNNKRPSSVRNDLVHEVSSLINRNLAVDKTVGVVSENPYPSLADLAKLNKADLLKLYREFGNKLMNSFIDMDKNIKIKWWPELYPREFMILALDHLSLHTGSLTFMFDYLNK